MSKHTGLQHVPERAPASSVQSNSTRSQSRQITTQPTASKNLIPNNIPFSLGEVPLLPRRSPASSPLQAKLQVGATTTPAEQQADDFAQRIADPPEKFGSQSPFRVSPSSLGTGDGFSLPRSFTRRLSQASGHGAALPKSFQEDIAPKLGANFRNVRVHTGATSAALNDAIGARAFTVGTDIHFNKGEYNPSTPPGQKLLAHELTHTMQQSVGTAPLIQRTPQRALRVARKALGLSDEESAVSFRKLVKLHKRALIDKGLLNGLQDIAEESEEEDQIWLINTHPELAPYDDIAASSLQQDVEELDEDASDDVDADDLISEELQIQLEALWQKCAQSAAESSNQAPQNDLGADENVDADDLEARYHRVLVDAGLVEDPELADLNQRAAVLSDVNEEVQLKQRFTQLLTELGMSPEQLEYEQRLHALEEFSMQQRLQQLLMESGIIPPSDKMLEKRLHDLLVASDLDPETLDMEKRIQSLDAFNTQMNQRRLESLQDFVLQQRFHRLLVNSDLIPPSDEELDQRLQKLLVQSGLDPEMLDLEQRAQALEDFNFQQRLQRLLLPDSVAEPQTHDEAIHDPKLALSQSLPDIPLKEPKNQPNGNLNVAPNSVAKKNQKSLQGVGGQLSLMVNKSKKKKEAPVKEEVPSMESEFAELDRLAHQQKFQGVLEEMQNKRSEKARQRQQQRHRRVMFDIESVPYHQSGFRRMLQYTQPNPTDAQLLARTELRQHRNKLRDVQNEMFSKRRKEGIWDYLDKLQPEVGMEQLQARPAMKKLWPVMQELQQTRNRMAPLILGGLMDQTDADKLLQKMGSDKSFGQAIDDFNPSAMLRLQRQLHNPKNLLNLLPGYSVAKSAHTIWHSHRKQKAMGQLQKGSGQSQALKSTLTSQKVHQQAKRNVAIASTVITAASMATGAASVGVSAAVSPLVSSLGMNAASAISSASSDVATGVSKIAAIGTTSYLTQRQNQKQQNKFGNSVVKAKGSKQKRGALISDYKNNRAFLYHLGHGAVQDDKELRKRGTNRDAEEARVAMKKRFGATANLDLTQRQPRKLKFGRTDWLTEGEREMYTQLKKGKITYDEIPKQMVLPILWQANKLFDYHVQLMKEKAEAQAAQQKAKQQAKQNPRPKAVPKAKSRANRKPKSKGRWKFH